MRTILVLNPKGGCGKSTIATHIAGYFAMRGKNVSLADCDPQCSSTDWLKIRPEKLAKITQTPVKQGRPLPPLDTDMLILDTAASIHDRKMAKIIRTAKTMIVPVLPSPVDIRAAERLFKELFRLRRQFLIPEIKIATVANRVNEATLAAAKLEGYLEKIKLPDGRIVPFMTLLRASQNYVHAAERGMTIFELAASKTCYDIEQWQPLLNWLNSKRSLP